jgi:putative ATP-binding cassette transporter
VIAYYLRQHRRELALATILSIVSACLSMLLLARIRDVAGSVAMRPDALAILEGIGLVLAMVGTNLGYQTFVARLSAAAVAALRRDLSRAFMALDYTKLRANEHLVTSALIADVTRLAPLLLILPHTLFNALMVIFGFAYLYTISAKLLLLYAVIVISGTACSVAILRSTSRRFRLLREREEALFELFGAIGKGKKELTLSDARARHFLGDVLTPAIETNRRLGESAQRWLAYGESWSTGLVFCAVFGVIYGSHMLGGEPASVITQFVIVSLFLMTPMQTLMYSVREISVGFSSVRHLETIGVAPWRESSTTTTRDADTAVLPPDWQRIHARDLLYQYESADGSGFRLGPIDFSVDRGEILFVIGGNGSGKSTLALLLVGLLSPTAGGLEVDGIAVDQNVLAAYRSLFTGVFADFYVFGHVIDRSGRLAADPEINAWLARMHLLPHVSAVSGVLSTVHLSQGQRKRLGLTQAYIDDADIYLFDEWAADQDPQFREYFYLRLLPELKQRGKTVVVITHDDRYFSVADRVVKFERGQLVESRVQHLHPAYLSVGVAE